MPLISGFCYIYSEVRAKKVWLSPPVTLVALKKIEIYRQTVSICLPFQNRSPQIFKHTFHCLPTNKGQRASP